MLRSRRWALITSFFAALGFTFRSASAQGASTLEVIVRDDSRALESIAVRLESALLLDGVRNALTDGTGRAAFDQLAAGFYDVTVEAEGYDPAIARDVRVVGYAVNRVFMQLSPRSPGGASY